MRNDTTARPRLLLQNIFNYGHFLVYASVFTCWGLSRGFEVHMLGRGLRGTGYERRFAGHPRVVLHDASPGERLDPLQADWAKPTLLRESLDNLIGAQRSLRPLTTVLLSTDDYLFEDVGITEPDFNFETPTYGLTTFGNRERYTAYTDGHACRLARMIERCSPFSAIFTLDEYHASDTRADPAYLAFLPDIYSEDAPDVHATAHESPPDQALSRFLSGAKGPVFPVIGKFDQRKNNSWVLEMAASIPEASCVVLGERVPGPDDLRIDGLLENLRAEGRLFERWGFVPEELFHMVLGCERTAFLPLPYSCHYGSSGIQLMGLAHAKPCLAPSNGLMARRIVDHGLGRVFAAGDRTDFDRVFREMHALGDLPFKDNCTRFMASFDTETRRAQIDRVCGLGCAEAQEDLLLRTRLPKSSTVSCMHEAMSAFWRGNAEAALGILNNALMIFPGDPVLLFRKSMVLLASGRREEAAAAIRLSLERGSPEELDFFVRLTAQQAQSLLAAGDPAGAIERIHDVLRLTPNPGEAPDGLPIPLKSGILSATTWRLIGSVLARADAHDEAVESFRTALRQEPHSHDCRLNISDALRYAGRFEESLDELAALRAIAPEWPGLYHKVGQVLFEMGEMEKALEHFLKEPRSSPHFPAARAYMKRVRDQDAR